MGLSDDLEDLDTEPRVRKSSDESGASQAAVEPGAPVWSLLELGTFEAEDTEITVAGHWYDEGDDPTVNARLSLPAGHLSLSMAPKRARTLAAELILAANHADGGESWD